ncbi:MAG: hypothetical protein WEC84_00985 [Candidatus Andersenbacteria bacterium]
MTLSEFALSFTSPEMWYLTAAALLVVAFLAMRFIFKRIKWSIIVIIFAAFVFLAYGRLFSETFEGGPEEFRSPNTQEQIQGLYDDLQSRALKIFERDTEE